MSEEQEVEKLRKQLSGLDFRADPQAQNRLYRRLVRQARRPSYRQPVHITIFSRLSAVIMLALVLGAFWGMLQTHAAVSPAYAGISEAQPAPISTPPLTLTAENPTLTAERCPLPTPLAPPLTENRPVIQTGTLLP